MHIFFDFDLNIADQLLHFVYSGLHLLDHATDETFLVLSENLQERIILLVFDFKEILFFITTRVSLENPILIKM